MNFTVTSMWRDYYYYVKTKTRSEMSSQQYIQICLYWECIRIVSATIVCSDATVCVRDAHDCGLICSVVHGTQYWVSESVCVPMCESRVYTLVYTCRCHRWLSLPPLHQYRLPESSKRNNERFNWIQPVVYTVFTAANRQLMWKSRRVNNKVRETVRTSYTDWYILKKYIYSFAFENSLEWKYLKKNNEFQMVQFV